MTASVAARCSTCERSDSADLPAGPPSEVGSTLLLTRRSASALLPVRTLVALCLTWPTFAAACVGSAVGPGA